jgi:hypothetical protein
MSATIPSDYLNSFKNMDEEFQSFMILAFIILIVIIYVSYLIYLSGLNNANCIHMDNLYPSINGHIRPISSNDPDCKFNLFDYYIKTAFNACSGGSYRNDFVNICNLKAVLKQGVRCLDFEIYSVDNQPVVSTSTIDSFFVKETFNSVDFSSVMTTISNYAFAGGTCPNPTDPILIHLRIKSNNQAIYSKMADIFKSFENLMLGKEYSFENSGENLGNKPLLNFQKKIILIVDRSNNAFLENSKFIEYINLTSNSIFVRGYTFFNIKNNPDIQELTQFNRRGMTIVFPDNGINPQNPSAILCRTSGCQMVAMRYQHNDNFLLENEDFFNKASYAFVLKPKPLRFIPVTISDPTPQKEEYSYATRNISSDFYNFNF